jgi:hypothetical protein
MPDPHTQDTQSQSSHPDSLEVGSFQVHDPWTFEFRRRSETSLFTTLSLHRKVIGTRDKQHRSRTVCVLTDQIAKEAPSSSFRLQWPEDKDSEVTVTSVSSRKIIVIATGITSGHMMDEDAWVSEFEDEDEDEDNISVAVLP